MDAYEAECILPSTLWLNVCIGNSHHPMSRLTMQAMFVQISKTSLCHPNHRLCGRLSQSGDVVQAVFVPSMPWWEPANADALDGYADCDPVRLEPKSARDPVVHQQLQGPSGFIVSSTAAKQAFNPANQVCCCTKFVFHWQAARVSSMAEEVHKTLPQLDTVVTWPAAFAGRHGL